MFMDIPDVPHMTAKEVHRQCLFVCVLLSVESRSTSSIFVTGIATVNTDKVTSTEPLLCLIAGHRPLRIRGLVVYFYRGPSVDWELNTFFMQVFSHRFNLRPHQCLKTAAVTHCMHTIFDPCSTAA